VKLIEFAWLLACLAAFAVIVARLAS